MTNFDAYPSSNPDNSEALTPLNYDQIDERIIETAEIIEAQTAVTRETISSQTEQLQADTSRQTEKVKNLALIERSDLEAERARLIEEVNRKCDALLRDINHQEAEKLERLDTEQTNGDVFLAACARVSQATAEEAVACREEHSELMFNIHAATAALNAICAEVNQLDERRLEVTIKRENIINDRNADEEIARLNRGRLRQLIRSSAEVGEAHFNQEQDILSTPATSADDINTRMREFEQGQLSYRQEHTAIMQLIGSVQLEIDRINTENESRKAQIDSLHKEIVELERAGHKLRSEIEVHENVLIGYKAIKKEQEATMQSLTEREAMVQTILENGIGALETVLPDFKEIVMAAIDIEKNYAEQTDSTDLATEVPGLDSNVIRISFGAASLGINADELNATPSEQTTPEEPIEAPDSKANAAAMKALVRAATSGFVLPTAVDFAQSALRKGKRAQIVEKNRV